MPTIAAIYRYPVKGLSPEPLGETTLARHGVVPWDRAFAIENGPTGFDPARPKYFPKIRFLMLMRNERLAALRTRFDETTMTLTVRKEGDIVAEGRLDTAEGRAALEAFFDAYEADELRGPAKILSAPGFSFSDVSKKVVSLINLETTRDMGRAFGADIDPLRFRGNLLVEGLPAWDEFTWMGREIAAGEVRFRAVKRIVRCAATNVDPASGARDMTIPASLLAAYGHSDCGIYLEVVAGGTIHVGDTISAI